MQPWLARIVDLDDYDFTTLLAATNWFRANPRSGLTVRSVPVPGMHTKWLAQHRSMVIACLGTPPTPANPPSRLRTPTRPTSPTATVTWSDTAGLVVIHSLGNHLDVLARLPWIRHDSWYWETSTGTASPFSPAPAP
jgi:Uncharacterized protein conserved in bacteria N-term (DUF3322)